MISRPLLDMERSRDRQILQLLTGAFVISIYVGIAAWIDIIPYPHEIGRAFIIQLDQGLIEALIDALIAIAAGFSLAVVLGILVGILMGVFDVVEEFFDPYLDALYALPLAAIVPAMIIWFGSGFTIRVIGVFLFTFFPVAINTLNGAKNTPSGLLEAAQSFGAGTYFMITRVIIYHQATYIAAGLRLGINLSVKAIVVIEILVAVSGFGFLISSWGAALQLEGVFSVVLTLMALGLILTYMLTLVERRLIHWDVSSH